MSYKNKYAEKFKQDMDKIIQTWRGYESDFYNNMVIPGFSKDPFLKPFMGTQSSFPHNLYLLWVWGPHPKLGPNDITLENLDSLWRQGKIHFNNGTSMSKGKKFEDFLAKSLTQDFMKKVAQVFPQKLKHVGQVNKREDFLISDLYSIDAKYSDLGTVERFNNIIKPWGNDYYSAINRIEAGIYRSMYREGASQGQFRPLASGQTKHHGILKYDKNEGWSEVTQSDYDAAGFGQLPSLRKNILYIFNDDGYWATYCLQEVIDWAAQHLEDLGFTDYTKDVNYKSYDPHEFWGFSQSEWKDKQLWYGSTR